MLYLIIDIFIIYQIKNAQKDLIKY